MKTLIFDFDGVIVDSFEVVLSVLQELHKKYDLPELTADGLRTFFEKNIWTSYAELGLSETTTQNLKDDIRKWLTQRNPEIKIYPGIKKVLQQLAKDNQLIIVTSNSKVATEQKLESVGLLDLFEKVIGIETPGHKQEKIKMALEESAFPSYLITDTTGDLEEVEDLLLTTIAVT
jgi:phosphoglycolate phosphatase-like HAD superfamily hydrolase